MAYPGHAIALAGESVAIGLPLHPARPLLAELTGRDPPFAAVGCAVAACKSCCHRSAPARHAATRGIADGKLESGNFKIDGLAAHCFAELVTSKGPTLRRQGSGQDQDPRRRHPEGD